MTTRTKVGITVSVILALILILLLLWLLKKPKQKAGALAAAGGTSSGTARDQATGNTEGVQVPGGQPEIIAKDSDGDPVKDGTTAPVDAVTNYPDSIERADLAGAYDGPNIE